MSTNLPPAYEATLQKIVCTFSHTGDIQPNTLTGFTMSTTPEFEDDTDYVLIFSDNASNECIPTVLNYYQAQNSSGPKYSVVNFISARIMLKGLLMKRKFEIQSNTQVINLSNTCVYKVVSESYFRGDGTAENKEGIVRDEYAPVYIKQASVYFAPRGTRGNRGPSNTPFSIDYSTESNMSIFETYSRNFYFAPHVASKSWMASTT